MPCIPRFHFLCENNSEYSVIQLFISVIRILVAMIPLSRKAFGDRKNLIKEQKMIANHFPSVS